MRTIKNGIIMIKNNVPISAALPIHLKMNDSAPNQVVSNSGILSGDASFVSDYRSTEDVSYVGKINSALKVGGAQDYIDLVLTPYSTFQKPFNISIWIKPDDGQKGVQQEIFRFTATDSDCVIELDGDGKVVLIYKAGGVQAVWQSLNEIYTDHISVWKHFSVNVTNSFIEFYSNGVKEDSSQSQDGDMSGVDMTQFGSENGAIKISSESDADYFLGLVDDFRLYDDALSSSEILQLYNNGNGTES